MPFRSNGRGSRRSRVSRVWPDTGRSEWYWSTSTTSFIDTGAAGTAGAVPTTAGTVWTVKNLFELKNARKVVVEWNTFENNWLQAQVGYAILFTARNTNGPARGAIEDAGICHNIVRHSSAAVNVLGDSGAEHSAPVRNVRIGTTCSTTSTRRGGGERLDSIGGPRDVIIDHNTIDHSGTTVLNAYGGTPTDRLEILGMQFTNNLARHSNTELPATVNRTETTRSAPTFRTASSRRTCLPAATRRAIPQETFLATISTRSSWIRRTATIG